MDHTGDYSAAFYLSGLCLTSSAAFVVLVDWLVQRRAAEEAKQQKAIGLDELEEFRPQSQTVNLK